MNLKLVVASMSVLGVVSLASCQVFAATDDATTTTTTTKHKASHHRKVHHHKMKHEREGAREHEREAPSVPVVQADYKGMGMMGAPDVCVISQNAMIMNEMTQSIGRSMPNPCNPGWFNRVQLSGGIYVQNAWGNRNRNFMGEGYQHLALNDVYLNIGAVINDWAKAFASISYNTETINDPTLVFFSPFNHVSEYSSAYSNNANGGGNNIVQIEQAYMTLGNFDMSPIFVQLGKQFQDFSRYEIHPITRSLTQVISETLATSAKIGFIASGFSGSLYAFDDPTPKVGQSSRAANYGASLGFEMPNDLYGFDIGAAYLYNMIGVNDVAYQVGQFTINNPASIGSFGYNNRVGAVAAYFDFNTGPFLLNVRWTQAVNRFNVNDLPKSGVVDLNAFGAPVPGIQGAKPWALGAQVGYGFDVWSKVQNVYVGYQASNQASGLRLPKYRWLAGYDIEVVRNTDFGIEYDYDKAYPHQNGSRSSNLVNLRAGVKFG